MQEGRKSRRPPAAPPIDLCLAAKKVHLEDRSEQEEIQP